MARTLKFGLLLPEATGYGRGVLEGIAAFAEDHPECRFRVEAPNGRGIGILRGWSPDGLIVMLNQKSLAGRLRELGVPIVMVCNLPGLTGAQLVQSDDVAVGRLGAEHLMESGAELFAFVGLTAGAYVAVRARAFADAVAAAGRRYLEFSPLGRDAGTRECAALRTWLGRTSKPLAIMTSNDICGRLVLQVCRDAGLRVPEDVAVLGVDNEDPLSRLVWPGLSSISLGTDQIGWRAAHLLHRTLLGNPSAGRPVFVPPLGVVARRSTRQFPVKDAVLSKALAFINGAVAVRFPIGRVVREVGVSRTSLERRFRRHLNRTPVQEIRRARIARARQLLIATDLPLKAIAERCGFAASPRLIEAFQAEVGCSPTTYRQRVRQRRRAP